MKKIINFWGNNGAAAAQSFTAIACMGMIRTDDEIFVRYVGFSENEMKFSQLYNKYSGILFGKGTDINFCNILLQNNISAEYDDEIFSLGFDSREISDKNKAMNRKYAELFFPEKDLMPLFDDLPKNERITVINCGNPCIDDISYALIPKESAIPINGQRYNVISGPCISAVYSVDIPCPDIYGGNIGNTVNIPDIPEIIEFMKAQGHRAETDIFNSDSGFTEKNRKNIEFLESRYDSEIVSFDSYIMRFADYISMKNPTVSASFVNMKTDGRNFYAPDIISGNLSKNRKADITSFINAVSIREIIINGGKYNDGRIYSFGSENYDRYNMNILFDREGMTAFIGFMITAVLISGAVRTSFSADCNTDLIKIAEKWAVRKAAFFGLLEFTMTPEKILKSYFENNENKNFGNEMIKYIDDFMTGYVSPVINFLIDIDTVSEQSFLLWGISENILNFGSNSASQTENNINEMTAGILGIPKEKTAEKVSGFFEEYKNNFPAFEREKGQKSAEYFEKILSYTMRESKKFAGGM